MENLSEQMGRKSSRPRPLSPSPSNTGEEGAFTRFLRALDDGEPPPDVFESLWDVLRSAIVGNLRSHGLWRAPPRYLGGSGPSWQEDDTLDDLLHDAYIWIFVDRIRSLRAQLEKKPNVDGLVFLHLRNFIRDRQKKNDPMGFKVFESLRCAVRTAIDERDLWVIAGDRGISNGTVLASSPDAEATAAIAAEPLASLVAAWVSELLPLLIGALGKWGREAVDRLRQRLLDLEALEVEVFRFKDIVDPLKREVRGAWMSLFDFAEVAVETPADRAAKNSAAEGVVILTRLVRPSTAVEDWDVFKNLIQCVAERIEKLDESQRTRGPVAICENCSLSYTIWPSIGSPKSRSHRPASSRIASESRASGSRDYGLT